MGKETNANNVMIQSLPNHIVIKHSNTIDSKSYAVLHIYAGNCIDAHACSHMASSLKIDRSIEIHFLKLTTAKGRETVISTKK